MRTTDDTSFTDVDYSSLSGYAYDGKAWKYGGEHWCNLQGRYTTIVEDFSGLNAQDESQLICNVAIMGTEYVRLDLVNKPPTSVTYSSKGVS